MRLRRAMSSRPTDAYREAVDRAALMLLAALRDHANPQFSSVQLEALRLRGGLVENARGLGSRSVHSVFADLRERATTILAAELKTARVADDVAAEMNRILDRLLNSIEGIFAER
jgi:hypothetical protein